jgi:hypothetical protein
MTIIERGSAARSAARSAAAVREDVRADGAHEAQGNAGRPPCVAGACGAPGGTGVCEGKKLFGVY